MAKPITIRLEDEVRVRVQKMVEKLQSKQYDGVIVITRSHIVRIALLRGLDVLERELSE